MRKIPEGREITIQTSNLSFSIAWIAETTPGVVFKQEKKSG